MDCVKNILDSMGQGDCGACICDVFPKICQEKEEIPEGLRISDIKEKDPEVEIRSDGGEEKDHLKIECYSNSCDDYIFGEFYILKKHVLKLFLLDALETCWYTGTIKYCLENLLDNSGHGSCKGCICKVIPQFVPECHQEKKIVPAEAKSLRISGANSEAEKYPQLRITEINDKDTEVEIRSDEGECSEDTL